MLSIPVLPEDCDTIKAAMLYAESGWYVGPVKTGTKHPGSVLGKSWHRKTTRDTEEIVAQWAGTSHGIFLHAGRSGAVIVDVDHPENLPVEIARHMGDAPFQATRKSDDLRGHLIFTCPEGRTIGNATGKLGSSWGEIRGTNGVIIVAPSTHPEPDGHYRWIRTGNVPTLPDAISSLLPDGTPGEDAATDAQVASAIATATSSSRPGALQGIRTAWERAMGAGESRHVTAITVTCWAAREAMAGLYPLSQALSALQGLYLESMGLPLGSGRILDERRAQHEWEGIVAWSVGQALAQPERVAALADASTRTPSSSSLHLPETFWSARPVLAHIRQAAHSRCMPADVVLHVVLARMASMVDHQTRATNSIGGNSLNIFTVPIGNSGAGKTVSMDIASSLINIPDWMRDEYQDRVPLGSGEGLAEMFMGETEEIVGEKADGTPKTRMVRAQTRHNALVYVDEGEQLGKMLERSGATIGATLRSAWVGATLGQMNAKQETRRVIMAGTYAIGAVLGFQPSTIRPLLDDSGSGTPQRLLFAWATDPAIPEEPVEHPGPIPNIQHVLEWTRGGLEMPIPESANREIWRTIRGRNADPDWQENPLDEHWTRHLCKISALLALLDHRTEITEDDWSLARTVWETSTAVRDHCVALVSTQVRKEAQARREDRVETAVESAVRSQEAIDARLMRIATRIAGYVRDGADTQGAAKRRLCSTDRPRFEEALRVAIDMGWVDMSSYGSTLTPGPSRPE